MTHDDAKVDPQALADAHLAPGGPVDFVRRFVAYLRIGHADVAGELLAPEFPLADLQGLDLSFLENPGWGISGMPRITDTGDEIVRYVLIEGMTAPTLIDKPTAVPGVDFVVRQVQEEWKMVSITHFNPG